MLDSELRDAINRARPGWSLEQQFYVSPEIYEFERRGWLARQWYVLGHCSEIPEPGSYMVREVLGESLIIVRGNDRAARGFYNVCRHRGSRICDRDGKGTSLTCPYHAWSYRLDGSLRSAPALSETIDQTKLGLHPVTVREIGGLILGSLQPGDEIKYVEEAERLLNYQGIPQARIAARRSYPTAANWKLVMENFEECYHCLPSHPEYCSLMPVTNLSSRAATESERKAWNETLDRWLREVADPNNPGRDWDHGRRSREDYVGAVFNVTRDVLSGGRKTASSDGKPVAPLMGKVPRFDGGNIGLDIRPFPTIFMLNDHAILFQFLPTGPGSTDVVVTWLVDGSTRESEVDVERMMWLWDVTTLQDRKIIEQNAAGIRSRAYTPGPYSILEPSPAGLVRNYLQGILADCNGSSR